jgi:hypothetical protein
MYGLPCSPHKNSTLVSVKGFVQVCLNNVATFMARVDAGFGLVTGLTRFCYVQLVTAAQNSLLRTYTTVISLLVVAW